MDNEKLLKRCNKCDQFLCIKEAFYSFKNGKSSHYCRDCMRSRARIERALAAGKAPLIADVKLFYHDRIPEKVLKLMMEGKPPRHYRKTVICRADELPPFEQKKS